MSFDFYTDENNSKSNVLIGYGSHRTSFGD